jgi:flagellum-specific peptidoglycan hydrolase FlgJ
MRDPKLITAHDESSMTPEQKLFLDRASRAALLANHPFPQMAAAEAALESAWGTSLLAIKDCNLFGMKAHAHPDFPIVSLPTKEVIGGQWKEVSANWEQYPDWPSCFKDRVNTLQRLAPSYPHYQAALTAPDPESYIRQVSLTWSTDPMRAAKCLSIYREYLAQLG